MKDDINVWNLKKISAGNIMCNSYVIIFQVRNAICLLNFIFIYADLAIKHPTYTFDAL